MKRLFVVFFAMILTVGVAAAQDYGIGAGGGLDIAMYDAPGDDEADFGVHVGGTYWHTLPQVENLHLKGTLAFGYTFAGSGEVAGTEYTTTLYDLAVIGEANYELTEQVYGIGGLGIHFQTIEFDYDGAFTGSGTADETDLMLHLGAGYKVQENLHLDGRFIVGGEVDHLRFGATYYFTVPGGGGWDSPTETNGDEEMPDRKFKD